MITRTHHVVKKHKNFDYTSHPQSQEERILQCRDHCSYNGKQFKRLNRKLYIHRTITYLDHNNFIFLCVLTIKFNDIYESTLQQTDQY